MEGDLRVYVFIVVTAQQRFWINKVNKYHVTCRSQVSE